MEKISFNPSPPSELEREKNSQMTINQAKELLLGFYGDYSNAITNGQTQEYEDAILQDWASKVIDKGQWE
jgi:hypothetical protein